MGKKLTISRGDIPEGIRMCLSAAQARLHEAEALLTAGHHIQTAVLFSFAVEEFGKAIVLRDEFDKGNDPATVHDFYDHEAKLVAAGTKIPEEKLLLHGGVFNRRVFDPSVFDTGNQVDFGARLSGLYVDWARGWRHGQVRVDPALLKANLAAVRAIIVSTQASWK